MRRFLALWITASLLLTALLPAAAAAEDYVVLPEKLSEIEAEAFEGNDAMTTVVIPKGVNRIGARAFANCENLREVYFGKSSNIDIARDAFEGCGDVSFYVYPDTAAELYVMAHGYNYGLMEEGSGFLEKALAIVAATGGTESVLQSSDFTSMRLIVRTVDSHLPDISEFNPVKIARDGENTFFIQFDDVGDTIDCYYYLFDDPGVVYVDSDANLELLDGVTGSRYVQVNPWDTEDPMGFAAYASYIAQRGQGSVTIAVVDSGVSIKAAYRDSLLEGVNLVPDGQSWSYDPNDHGSMIASIIKDCAGNANVKILPVRVYGSNGIGSLTLIGAGIKAAIERGADIINISMNFDANAYVTQWINTAVSRGITVVVSAGNNSRDIRKVYPANVDGVVAVSGIDSNYALSASSNYGDNIAYCAPDMYITPTDYSGAYSGTSFAAPMIATALAMVKLDPYHTVADLRDACRDLGAEGRDSAYGYGLPQLDKISKVYVDSLEFTTDIPQRMAVGDTLELNWSILPDYATDKTVSFESSDESVAAIETDQQGKVQLKALKQGSVAITMSANNVRPGGHVSTGAAITVVQPVTGISVVGAGPRLYMNRTMHLSADIQPANATSRQFTWRTTNESIAAISEDGLLTPVSKGTVGVYAVANDGYGAQSEMVNVEVVNVPDADSIELLELTGIDISSGSIQVVPGDHLSLAALVLPEEAEQDVVWSSRATPEGSITVNAEGVVTAEGAGNATITATATNGVKAELAVESVILPVSIRVAGDSIIDVGATSQMRLTFTPEDTTDTAVNWESTRPDVASVDQNGLVTGRGMGTATIIAKSKRNQVPGAFVITVRQPYTLSFNANGGSVSTASKLAYSKYAVGELPTPTRDYHTFEGWFTEATGGARVTASTALECSDARTIYAHWREKPYSNWVLESEVPANARIVSRAPAVYQKSTASSLAGYVRNGEPYWKLKFTGSKYYSTEKPYGVKTEAADHWINNQIENDPYGTYNNGSTKREVRNEWAGFVYWHWMYNVQWHNVTNRMISSRKGTYNQYGGTSGGYWFGYFYAIMSSEDCPYLDNLYCCSRNEPSYNCARLMGQVPQEDKDSSKSGVGSNRFFRFKYYRSTYSDYEWTYRYVRKAVQYQEK